MTKQKLLKVVRRMFGLSLTTWENILTASACFAALAAVVTGISTWAIVLLQRQELAASKLEFEHLKSANLELERQIMPRRLDAVSLHEVVSPLQPFSGKKVKLASYALDSEGTIVAMRIYEALNAAKLLVDKEQATGVAPFGAIAFGVFVDGPNRELVAALVAALAPVQATANKIPHDIGSTDAEATVFVAAKPPFLKQK